MVDEFIRNKIVKSPGAVLSQNEVYEKYKKFCCEQNEKAETKIWFGRKMNIFGFSSKQISKNERIYFDFLVAD
ncbi:hypothetical protein FC756_26670 [Lysinibacillus mangiferihumi]|uniref:DNA primase/nucleoside triphosphatase C-terminal domain-containing protein n=1 Tax=Lysinibacillus mangiferihumi TaxID=1130819 RepID=A0A4U2XZI3_9BACI|nr:hypothetical protein [Lysinibacillus mangiferihumi]TKI52905.1 hypothetical protein FC756_26670 [Lysinibacillus mangiferihumi]